MKLYSRIACALLTLAHTPFTFADESTPKVQTPTRYQLEELALLALENNQDLEVERLTPLIQADAVTEAWGAFNPVFFTNFNYEDRERNLDQRTLNSVSNPLLGLFGGGPPTSIYEEENYTNQIGLEGLIPTGTRYNLTLTNQKLENTSNDFDPEYVSEAYLRITQPLLKGFGLNYNLAVVRVQENRKEQEKIRLQGVVNTVLQETLSAGIELLFAQKNLQVKAESVGLAEQLLGENQRRFEEGRMSEIDVIQAQSRISEAREEALGAKAFYVESLNNLRALIYEDAEVYIEQPIEVEGSLGTLQELPSRGLLLETAKRFNPNLQIARLQIDEREISFQRAKRDLLPELNLRAGAGYQGLDFDENAQAIQDFSDRDGPNWNVGIEFRYPIGNQAAKGQKRAAQKRLRQAEYNLAATHNTLVTQLDEALSTVSIAEERMQMSAESVKFAQASLDAEGQRLNNGRTTSFNVAETQKNLSIARTRELAAQVEYERAIINLWALVGQLDDQLNLQLEDDSL